MFNILQGDSYLRLHFVCWRIMGLLPTEEHRKLYTAYSIIINVLITVGYPLHLMIGLLMSTSMYEIIKNLDMNLTCLMCSIKTLVAWLKLSNIQNIMSIIERQNSKIYLTKDEAHYYKYMVIRNVRQLLKVFLVFYGAAWIMVELSVLWKGLMGNWDLMFPAYFPFNPFANNACYIVAHIYQFLGATLQIFQDFTIDTFAFMHLALLSGQAHCLNMRVSKLGQDSRQSHNENNKMLLECIMDHKDLLLYRGKLENIISFYMFLQIFITSFNMCMILVFVIFFTKDPFTFCYYFFYFMAITMEILPACYYGTLVELEFKNLTYAIFSSNWVEQNEMFKKNLRIFAETTKKPLRVAAYLFHINLESFLVICKNAYSLFALIMNFK